MDPTLRIQLAIRQAAPVAISQETLNEIMILTETVLLQP